MPQESALLALPHTSILLLSCPSIYAARNNSARRNSSLEERGGDNNHKKRLLSLTARGFILSARRVINGARIHSD